MNRKLHEDVIDLVENHYRNEVKDLPPGAPVEDFTLEYAQALVSVVRTFCANVTVGEQSNYTLRMKIAEAIAFGQVTKIEETPNVLN